MILLYDFRHNRDIIHTGRDISMAIHGYEICLDMRCLAPLRPLRLRPQLPGLLGGTQAGVRGG